MKIAYLDCSSGVSGDMFLGAIIGAGLPIEDLERALKSVPVTGYRLRVHNVVRSNVTACKVDVVLEKSAPNRPARTWRDVRNIVANARLPRRILKKTLSAFRRIFEAEAQVHGTTIRSAHLHELGALDCIIDIFGTIIGFDLLGVERITSSPVNLGTGFTEVEGGVMPVPAPATVAILKDVPVYARGARAELTTPTGAALLRELSADYGDMPHMTLERVGIGAGSRDFAGWSNIFRLFIGAAHPLPERAGEYGRSEEEVAVVIETNIDDMNPQIFEHVVSRLFDAGALDVFLTQVIMKKGRPGVQLTVLCTAERKGDVIRTMFRETSSIGVRYREVRRCIMRREMRSVETPYGAIRVKISRYGDDIVKVTPEYDDCRKIAQKSGLPLIDVMKMAARKSPRIR